LIIDIDIDIKMSAIPITYESIAVGAENRLLQEKIAVLKGQKDVLEKKIAALKVPDIKEVKTKNDLKKFIDSYLNKEEEGETRNTKFIEISKLREVLEM
jgi:hypothetical protein